MSDFATADLCDQASEDVRVVDPVFYHYGGSKRFYGQISTVKIFEDNGLVRQLLASPGQGRILVIDGGASLRRALIGDQLATLAVHNGWRGALVYGAIRDSRAIASMPIGLMALGTHPMKTEKKNQGDISIPLHFGGVMFVPDHWLYADEDGIIVSARPLIAP
jgi:regulator of ribonuclease activity A